MTLDEARDRIEVATGRKFVEVFSPEQMQIIKNHRDRGGVGKALELLIGKPLNSKSEPDFEDGELKTNKCTHTGAIEETIAVSQIDTVIDNILQKQPFEETHMYNKINSMLYVPVCEEGPCENWVLLPTLHILIEAPQYREIRDVIESDYYFICDTIKEMVETDEQLTTLGGRYLQIRPKSSLPYRPIFSKLYNKDVAKINFAFYLKRAFIKDIRRVDKNYAQNMMRILNSIEVKDD